MPQDPIERFSVDVEVLGIPMSPGQPPLTDTYFHVRHRSDGAAERATLGLPAYEGKEGKRGAPGAIHQGERTTGQLEALRKVLGIQETNFYYRNTDTNDAWVWTGETFIIYYKAFATPGPPGPAPKLLPGEITMGDDEPLRGNYGMDVTGANGVYQISMKLPEPKVGEQGPPGPSGSVILSEDVNPDQRPQSGDSLIYFPDVKYRNNGRLEWVPSHVETYVVPPNGFPNISKRSRDASQILCTLSIPSKNYPYRFEFSGGVDINSKVGHQVDIEIRLNDSTNGRIVGIGKGQEGEGWREVSIREHSDVQLDPNSNLDIIQPGTPSVLYVIAVKRTGILFGWDVRNDRAQLRVKLVKVANPVGVGTEGNS